MIQFIKLLYGLPFTFHDSPFWFVATERIPFEVVMRMILFSKLSQQKHVMSSMWCTSDVRFHVFVRDIVITFKHQHMVARSRTFDFDNENYFLILMHWHDHFQIIDDNVGKSSYPFFFFKARTRSTNEHDKWTRAQRYDYQTFDRLRNKKFQVTGAFFESI